MKTKLDADKVKKGKEIYDALMEQGLIWIGEYEELQGKASDGEIVSFGNAAWLTQKEMDYLYLYFYNYSTPDKW
jgi:hypothetical protein